MAGCVIMEGIGYVLLDTKAFDAFLEQKASLLQRYDNINSTYDEIKNTLLENWVGNGADAFSSDAEKIKANIVGIYDILKTMCETLSDCKAIFQECDTALGEYNRNPQ